MSEWKDGIFLELVSANGPLGTPMWVSVDVDGKVRLVKHTERATVYNSNEVAMQALIRLPVENLISDPKHSFALSARAYEVEKHTLYWEARAKSIQTVEDWSYHFLEAEKYMQKAQLSFINGPKENGVFFLRKAIISLMDAEKEAYLQNNPQEQDQNKDPT